MKNCDYFYTNLILQPKDTEQNWPGDRGHGGQGTSKGNQVQAAKGLRPVASHRTHFTPSARGCEASTGELPEPEPRAFLGGRSQGHPRPSVSGLPDPQREAGARRQRHAPLTRCRPREPHTTALRASSSASTQARPRKQVFLRSLLGSLLSARQGPWLRLGTEPRLKERRLAADDMIPWFSKH